MITTKLSTNVAMATAMASGWAGLPPPHLLDALNYKQSPGNKGRSNNKPGARAKDRARAKAAHKSRMAQKRRK